MAIAQKQVFTTEDGKQFESLEAAEAHEVALANADRINTIAESYANTASAPNSTEAGLVGRTRAFNVNVAKGVLAFLIAQRVEIPEDFAAIEPSEELQARLDAEEARVAEMAAAKAKKSEGEKSEEKEAEVAAEDEDLFE